MGKILDLPLAICLTWDRLKVSPNSEVGNPVLSRHIGKSPYLKILTPRVLFPVYIYIVTKQDGGIRIRDRAYRAQCVHLGKMVIRDAVLNRRHRGRSFC